MENLQEIIDARAKKRATEVVQRLVNAFGENHDLQSICSAIYVLIPSKDKDQKTNDLRSAFWSTGNTIPKLMIEQLTEIYIPEESKKFVEDVERIKDEMDDLMGK